MTKEMDFDSFNNLFTISDRPDAWVGEWSGLIRKTEWRTGKNRAQVRALIGSMVGGIPWTDPRNGYKCWIANVNRRIYKIHRIVYLLSNGSISADMEIDHINGNSLDNTPNNLRAVFHEVNHRNRKQQCDNKSGITGVHLMTNKAGNSYAMAYWNENGRRKQKCIPVASYSSTDEAMKAAKMFRESKIIELNEKLGDSGYTERHGIERI